MKNIKSNGIFLVSLFMILGLFQARAQYTLTYQNGEPGGGVFQKVAVDGLGNSYYTGTFADSVHFGSVTLYKPASSTGPGTNYFVAKMDAGGNWVWAKTIQVNPLGAGSPGINISNVAADNSGNAYITGWFRGIAVFGNQTIKSGATASNNACLFVAKMNSSGNFLWAVGQQPKAGYEAWGKAITTDASGNVYVTGTMGIKAGTPTINGIYWAKYNASGAKQWDNTLSPATGSYPSSFTSVENRGCDVAVDGSGNVYITGNLHGTVKFANGSGLTVSSYNPGVFTAKLNSGGAVQWVKVATPSTPNGSSYPRAYSAGLYLDATGSVYIGGEYTNADLLFTGSASTLLNPTIVSYSFIAKYSSGGALSWGLTTADSAVTRTIFRQPSGNTGVVSYRKGANIISEYSSSGNTVGSTTSTGGMITGILQLFDAAATSSGYILCGNVRGAITVGNLALTGACAYPNGECEYHDMLVVGYTGSAAKPTGIAGRNIVTAQQLHVYPNPIHDILHIRSNSGSNIGQVVIYDQTGRKVIEKSFTESDVQLDMQTLPAGVYFLRANGDGSVLKLLKAE